MPSKAAVQDSDVKAEQKTLNHRSLVFPFAAEYPKLLKNELSLWRGASMQAWKFCSAAGPDTFFLYADDVLQQSVRVQFLLDALLSFHYS